jgi:nucleotide-binding universal stress UspA family protein
MRTIEAVVLLLVITIAACYAIEIFVLPQTRPSFPELGAALLTPGFREHGMLYVAIGIIGATVMPHNLYLHSALVQSRSFQRDEASMKTALRFNTIDSVAALAVAFLVNAAILILAGLVFFGKTSVAVPGSGLVRFSAHSDWIRIAHLTLAPLLGTALASTLFVVALLASGQSSTITGTLAGQVVMEGFMHWRIRPWVRRLITRLIAILPAIFVIGIRGQRDGPPDPESGRPRPPATPRHVPAATVHQLAKAHGQVAPDVGAPHRRMGERDPDHDDGRGGIAGVSGGSLAHHSGETVTDPRAEVALYRKIVVPLDASPTDRAIVDHIRPIAKLMGSRVVLLHVATGWAAQWFGSNAVSPEVDEDRAYLDRIRDEFAADGIPAETVLAYGDPAHEIVRWVEENGCDLVAMSTHGHRALADVFLGTTAIKVQHGLKVPVLLLRAK